MSHNDYKYKVKVSMGGIHTYYAKDVKKLGDKLYELRGVIEKNTPNGYKFYDTVTVPMVSAILMELDEPYTEEDIVPGG